MAISCNINKLIKFLQEQKKEGYETVELIDDARAAGWHSKDPTIEFIVNKHEPIVLGIDVRTKNK